MSDKAKETPRTDALEEHGSKYYNHPRYDAKMIKHARTLERELSDARELLDTIVNRTMSGKRGIMEWATARETQAAFDAARDFLSLTEPKPAPPKE